MVQREQTIELHVAVGVADGLAASAVELTGKIQARSAVM
jgi:hypothetical protein